MIETAPTNHPIAADHDGRELAPNVWLRQTEREGQFVEIVMPPFELSDLLTECEPYFPLYAVQVFQTLAKHQTLSVEAPITLSDSIKDGLKKTQILGTVLTRYQVRGKRVINILPELQQAFGLAMKGRLRLTADRSRIYDDAIYKFIDLPCMATFCLLAPA